MSFPEVWGLTGGIASGKSLAAKYFQQAGIPVLDADQISRELTLPGGAARDAVTELFGTSDRAEIRKRVFAEPELRKKLEAILHPLIRQESASRIQQLAALGHRLVIYEAALLVETGRFRDFSGLIVVDSPADTRKQRLMERDRIARELADQIIAAQIDDETRRKAATAILVNTGSADDLQRSVTKLIAERGWNR